MLLEYRPFKIFILFDLFPLLFQYLNHSPLLVLFNLKNFSQRHQIFILFLSKIDLKTRQIYSDNLFVFVLIFLIVYLEINIIHQRINTFFQSTVFEIVALFDKRVITQESRIYNHWILLPSIFSIAFYVQATKIKAPTLIFIQRTYKNRTIDIEFHIQDFLQFISLQVLLRTFLFNKTLILLNMRSLHHIRIGFFETKKFLKLLHVNSFIDDCNSFHITSNSLLLNCFIFQQLAFIYQLQK